jgi:hypothetical protein
MRCGMTDQRQEASPSRAVRFLVRYEGGDVSVIDQQEFEMAVPPSDPLKGFEGESGFWIELRDGKDQVLYRRIHENPIQQEVEAFEEDGTAVRAAVEKPTGVFTFLVPDLPGADHVALVSSPLEPEQGAAKPAELLTSIPMRRKG